MIRSVFSNIETEITSKISRFPKILICNPWFNPSPNILSSLRLKNVEVITTPQGRFFKGDGYDQKALESYIPNASLFIHRDLKNILSSRYIVLINEYNNPTSVLITSYNFTPSTVSSNDNLLIVDEPNLALDYLNNFNNLKKFCDKVR